jgi:hypothetical protein
VSQSATSTVSEVRDAVEEFLVGLSNDTDSRTVEDILFHGHVPTSGDLGFKPERYAENNLIGELLEAVGLEYEEQPYADARNPNWPDFELTDLDIEPDVIGENKPLNACDKAIPEIKDYLDKKSVGAEYGIATDGFDWYLYKIEVGGDSTNYPEVRHIDLKPVLREVARERNLVGQTAAGETEDVEDVLQEFVDVFGKEEFEGLLSQRAPRELRDARKRDVEEFYELYIELLFGEGDEHSYETNLMNDIEPPKDADESEQRLFVVTLMNRLLFVKFLESREVMDEGFLRGVVDRHEDGEAWGSLYRSYIQPLFYDLLNTPKDERKEKYQGTEPFESVPYLNGGLFRTNVDREKEYDVADRILPIVIDDLIEGSELELRNGKLDPAVLGSVFEKTINHMGGGKTQKDIGAYYTPNDVTELVSEQTVDPKIEETLVEVFVDEFADEDSEEGVRETLENEGLSGMLRKVENSNDIAFRTGEGVVTIEFSDDAVVQRAKEEVEDLKVLDPACGSGHFLTTAMDEIHRVQLSLMRGMTDEDEVPAEERYKAKQKLALNSTYGVDVDGVAAEIAKLRIWLKIVEENGWSEEFGRLPNIDVNIMSGNSLVGFPIVGEHYPGEIWDGDVEKLVELRKEYKQGGDVSKEDITKLLEDDIRPRVNEKFVENLTYTVETRIESIEEFREVVDAIPGETFYPYVEKVQVQNADGSSLSEEQQEYLDERGFRTYSKSANMDVEDWQSDLESSDRPDWRTHYHVMMEELEELLEEGYVFSEFVRQPLSYDLENIYGDPFHWVVEFAEVAEVEGASHSVDFDLIVGNPPYGDILGDEAEMFTENYKTGGINEVSAQFVER